MNSVSSVVKPASLWASPERGVDAPAYCQAPPSGDVAYTRNLRGRCPAYSADPSPSP